MSEITTRVIPGHPGYEVGDDGSMWSTKRGRRRRLAGTVVPDGYVRVELWRGGRRKSLGVHTLVLLAFVGPPPAGCEGCHGDGDPANNRLTNLRWGTPKENQADRVRHGTANRGERHGHAKLTEAAVIALRLGRLKGETAKQAAARLGVSEGTVHAAVTGRSWKHLPAPQREVA